MQKAKIHIVSFSVFDPELLKNIAHAAGNEFATNVIFSEGHIDLSDFFDPSRGQYQGNELLKIVEDDFSDLEDKTIALFSVDLFIPILTYIYGQAYLGGNSAIASSHRLSNARYGLKEDLDLFRDRMAKEVIHELGHTFGLIHCYNPKCVMRSSTYVEEIDQKNKTLCSSCKSKYLNPPL
jgi:archaemetzincin